jgi:uncharacterized protein DUF6152
MIRRILLALALAAVPLAHEAFAHHNMTAFFDFNDRVTLSGALMKVDWRNPHIYLTVDMKGANGEIESWQAEGPSPTWFRIREVGKDDFVGIIGKPLSLELSRARDKSRSGLIRTLTLPSGRVVSACPQNC